MHILQLSRIVGCWAVHRWWGCWMEKMQTWGQYDTESFPFLRFWFWFWFCFSISSSPIHHSVIFFLFTQASFSHPHPKHLWKDFKSFYTKAHFLIISLLSWGDKTYLQVEPYAVSSPISETAPLLYLCYKHKFLQSFPFTVLYFMFFLISLEPPLGHWMWGEAMRLKVLAASIGKCKKQKKQKTVAKSSVQVPCTNYPKWQTAAI